MTFILNQEPNAHDSNPPYASRGLAPSQPKAWHFLLLAAGFAGSVLLLISISDPGWKKAEAYDDDDYKVSAYVYIQQLVEQALPAHARPLPGRWGYEWPEQRETLKYLGHQRYFAEGIAISSDGRHRVAFRVRVHLIGEDPIRWQTVGIPEIDLDPAGFTAGRGF